MLKKRSQLAGFVVTAVVIATVIAVLLENWLLNTNLVLVFVLAVIILGLRYGPAPAIFGAVLSFFSFNYFLTEPRYTLDVVHDEEVATLVFLFLIALACGPAASRIRSQFEQLRRANRHSEALRRLGERLSLTDSPEAVWKTTENELSRAFDCNCRVFTCDDNGEFTPERTPDGAASAAGCDAVRYACGQSRRAGRFTPHLNSSPWTLFPVTGGGECRACAALDFPPGTPGLGRDEEQLIAAMLKQASDTWRRITLSTELENVRLQSEIDQLRSALLSSVSHDLKSPLAAMMGSAESLRYLDKQLQAGDRRELIDTILEESRRLESYIQNLLDMTRLSHGGLRIERDWTAVTDIVGSALSRLKRYHPSFRSRFRLLSTPPLLYVHAALVEQALFNVLENAAKFTPEDETVEIVVFAEDGHCVIAVDDKGPGIAVSAREKIFDMFYMVAEGDQKPQGTGMGLAICRGMIGAHGGTVHITEPPGGRGTRVLIKLPIAEPASERGQVVADSKAML